MVYGYKGHLDYFRCQMDMSVILSFGGSRLALLLALVSRGNVGQANVPMFEAPNLSRGIVHNSIVCVLPLPKQDKRILIIRESIVSKAQ